MTFLKDKDISFRIKRLKNKYLHKVFESFYSIKYTLGKKGKKYVWRLKNAKYSYENTLDINLCFDRFSIDSFLNLLNSESKTIEIIISKFPKDNPRHLDIGFELHNRGFKENIVEYNLLKFIRNENLKHIEYQELHGDIIFEFPTCRKKMLINSLKKSKTYAYAYDNSIEIMKRNDHHKLEDCKLYVWAGYKNNIVYC